MTKDLDLLKVCKQTIIKKNFRLDIRMINLSLNELKLVAESRDIKDYENKFENELIKILSELKLKIKFCKQRMKEINEKFNELRDRFSKPKIKEIRRKLYGTEIKKNISKLRRKKIEKNLLELEKNLFKPKKYYNYDVLKIKE